MRAATSGAKPEWYETPADVEKVAICRLSGARATEACRHSTDFAAVPAEAATISDTGIPQVPQAPPDEPPVYEDYFPIGAVPSEPCPLHNAAAGSVIGAVATSGTVPATPIVDAALQQAAVAEPSPVTVRSPRARIVVEKTMGPDGVMRYVMRQIH
jgi:hypothetical protein